MEQISNFVWNEKFWLPEGYSWDDFQSTPEHNKPQFYELWNVPVIAIIIVCIRYLFERFIASPFCLYIGIKDGTSKTEKNSICEQVFTTVTKAPDAIRMSGLAKQLGWSEQRVDRWFKKRRKAMQVSMLKKATECCWRCVFYFWLFSFGAVTLLRTDWFYDSNKWMEGYIREQDFNIYLKSYYLMELAFYTSLLFSQFIDAKRKDFYQMFLHHVVTILLILTSYVIAQFRIGTVIMFLHDSTDYWLEAAKVFNYAKKQKICDNLFVCFALAFFLSRWIFYPFWVLHCMIFYSWNMIGPYPSYYFFTILLCTLQVLHLYWGMLIVKMVYQFTVEGKVAKDTRSEDESSGDEHRETNHKVENKKKK